MKWIFTWAPPHCASVDGLDDAAQGLSERLARFRPFTLHRTSRQTPRFAVVPFRRSPLAMVTISGDDDRMNAVRCAIEAMGGSLAGYRVEATAPRAGLDVRRAGRRDGVSLVTLFRQNPRLSRERFFREWFERHTPLSLRIHPMVEYVRNVVVAPVVAGSPAWDGIVMEHFAHRDDVVRPSRLFGSKLTMIPNMVLVGLHVSYFLEMRTLETYLMDEWLVET